MPAPVLSSFAQRLYDEFVPLALEDAANEYALAWWLATISNPFQLVDDLARDTSAGEGWSIAVDLARVPDFMLDWLGQFVGVRTPVGSTPAVKRALIAAVGGWNRGTSTSMRGAVQALLTGNKTVIFAERDGGPYSLTIITRTSETPDVPAVLAALKAQKPGGILLNYVTSDGNTYLEVRATKANYTAVIAAYANYTAMRGY